MGLMFTPTWAQDGLPPVDPYAPPFYNNEDIPLPAWVKEELRDINSQLRAKLTPADYMEILKGEHVLLGCYKTKAQLKRSSGNSSYVGDDELKDLAKLKAKLHQILENPEDRKLFARAEILSSAEKGTHYRDTLRTTDEAIAHVGPGGVLTTSEGQAGGTSTTLTFWDSRTCRIKERFACPHYLTQVSSKTLPDGTPVYAMITFYGEVYDAEWNGNYYSSYFWAPLQKQFQTLKQDVMAFTISAYNSATPGDLMAQCTPNTTLKLGDSATSIGLHVEGWDIGSHDELKELGIRQHKDKAGKASNYVAVRREKNGSISFFKAFDKDGTKPDENIPAENLDFSTLTRKKLTDTQAAQERRLQLKKRLAQIMVPAPTPYQFEGDDFLESENVQLVAGDESNGYIPFALISDHHGECSDPCGSILGILTPENEVYLYDWKAMYDWQAKKAHTEGHFIPYATAAQQLTGEDDSGPQISGIPYIRQLTLQDTPGSNTLRLCCILDGCWDDAVQKDVVKIQHFTINKEDWSYKVEKEWTSSMSKLAPVWIEEYKLLLQPVSNECYDMIRMADDGTEEKIANLYIKPGQGYAIVLTNGHYTGSPGCESFLGYAENGRSVGLKALAPWRNRPAEVLEVLGGNPDDIAALKAATTRWLKKQGFQPDNLPNEPAITELPAATVALPELKTSQEMLEFEVTLQAANKAITTLEIRADGTLVPQGWDNDLLVPAGQSRNVTVNIPLASGQNWLEVTPIDSMGIAGDTQRFRTLKDGENESALYVVTLGVSDYQDDTLDLQYAAKDARDVAAAFEKYGSGKVNTLVLTDAEVQDAGVLNKVKSFLSSATINDRVILYIAGHGMLDDNLEYRYAPAAFDTENMTDTGISMSELKACIQSSAARKYLMLMDTCHSGTLGEEDMEKLAANGIQLPHGVRAIQNRGMKVKAASAALGNAAQKKRYLEDLFATQDETRGINIIAGTAGSEYALESDTWQNGVFAASIVGILKERLKSDLNGDGFLNVDEFQTLVVKRVSELTGGTQVPTSVSAEDNVMNIAVGRMPWLDNLPFGEEIPATVWQQCEEWARSGCTADDATTVLQMLAGRNMPHTLLHLLLDQGGSASEAATAIAHNADATALRIAFERGATAEDATSILNNCSYPKAEVLQILIHAGGDVKQVRNLLHRCNSAETLKMILEAGADPNEINTYTKETVIQEVLSAYGRPVSTKLEMLQILLQHGADVNATNNIGNTVLHNLLYSPTQDTQPLIDALLRAGADINIRNNKGRRPQEPGDRNYAYLQQRAAMIQGNAGQSYPNQAAGQGGGDRSSLDPLIARMAALKCKHATSALYQKRLLTLLPMIRNGAHVDITLPETKGNTALHYSCAIGSLSITRWLLEHGANANAVTNAGATPMMCVGSDNRAAIIQALKAHGAGGGNTAPSPQAQGSAYGGGGGDRSSLDPLIARMAALKCKQATSALYQKRLLTLLPLIRNGAHVDITLPETKGNTALHYSCAIGSLSITRWLLEHGANANAVTHAGATPLQCVGSDNRAAIIQALKAHGAR